VDITTEVTPEVVKENRRRWVEALRSGRYRQGHSVLRGGDDTYCCLGVACDIIDPEGWEGGDVHEGEPCGCGDPGCWTNRLDAAYAFDGIDTEIPPGWILEQVAISRADAEVLATWNDAHDLTFEEIANHIEAVEYGLPSTETTGGV
jgi:hypothetical protein